ncbi:hypothetical protein TSOC_005368, partial [Tetrabaena socialis]
ALSDGGDAAVSALSNSLLALSHLPGLPLPKPLAQLRPDLRAAAAAKLARRQAALAAALRERVAGMAGCVEALQAAVAALDSVEQGESWMRDGPVFATLPLPRVRQLLGGVAANYRLEYDSKAAVQAALTGLMMYDCTAAGSEAAAEAAGWAGMEAGGATAPRADAQGFAALAAEAARGGGGGIGNGAGGRGGGAGAGRLPDLCTTYVCVWMLSPYLEEQAAEEALGGIGEDMAGF